MPRAIVFDLFEKPIIVMLDQLRRRGLQLGVISNCFAEDVTAWPRIEDRRLRTRD
jgi:hypothetical protein